jgi:oxygen-independent coproporphyrinogen-3 oxidase
MGSRRTMNHLLPETYCAAVERGEATASNVEAIDHQTQMAETMLLGLRLLDAGVEAVAFRARHGVALDAVFGDRIDDLAAIGLMERTGSGVRLTQRGLLLANEVIARFL